MVFIYVLQLKDGKWYIGKTESSKFRIDTHFDSKGSGFTKKYPPEEIYQIIPECDKYDEDKYVKKYMDKYGIDNVRGGSYSSLELTEDEIKLIQKELWGANDLCFLCGGEHFVKDCPNHPLVEELEIDEIEPIEIDNELNEIDKEVERSKIIKHYENELFELTVGCWVLLADNKYEIALPRKIFEDYNYDFNNCKYLEKYNITDLTFKMDRMEVGSYPCIYTGMVSGTELKIDMKSKDSIVYIYKFNRGKYSLYTYNKTLGYNYEYECEKNLLEQKLFILKNLVFDNKVYINDEYNLKRNSYQKKIESSVEMIFRKIDNNKQLCGTRQIQKSIMIFQPYDQAFGNGNGKQFEVTAKPSYYLSSIFQCISTTIRKNFDIDGSSLRLREVIRFGEENTLSKLHSVVFTEMYVYYIFTNLGNKTYTITFEENNIIKDFFKYNLHLIINSIQHYGYHVSYYPYIPTPTRISNQHIVPSLANYHQTSSFAIILED